MSATETYHVHERRSPVPDDPRFDAPPPPGVLARAIRRYWTVVLFMAALGASAGVTYGLSRPPLYTASSELAVGRSDLQTQSLPGYAEGTRNLAAAYSRLITSPRVLNPAAERAGRPVAELRDSVTASPLAGTSLIEIFATADSEREAIRRARAVTAETQRFVRSLDSGDRVARSALRRARRAQRAAAEARLREGRLRGRRRADPGSVSTASIARAAASAAEAELQAEAYGNIYIQGTSRARTSFSGVELLAAPDSATSDRSRTLQVLGFIGLIGGTGAGIALAVALMRRRLRRRL